MLLDEFHSNRFFLMPRFKVRISDRLMLFLSIGRPGVSVSVIKTGKKEKQAFAGPAAGTLRKPEKPG
jgi:hypothetical protein